MRRLPTRHVFVLSLAAGLVAAALLYHQAWRIPVVQNLRDTRLFLALVLIATPLLALAAAAARITPWLCAVKSGAIFIAIAAPVFGLTGAFEGVRRSSEIKSVLCNIRQLAAAADQYFLEHGVTIVNYDDLVGPSRYIKALNARVGEDYRANFPYHQGGVLSAEFPDGRIVNYHSGDLPPDYKDVFAAGDPRPSWRPQRPPAFSPRPGASHSATPSADSAAIVPGPTLTDAELAQIPGARVHSAPRGTMCASCHAKKG